MIKNKKSKAREPVGEIINNTTCFNEHARYKKSCKFEECKYWMQSKGDFNCVLISIAITCVSLTTHETF